MLATNRFKKFLSAKQGYGASTIPNNLEKLVQQNHQSCYTRLDEKALKSSLDWSPFNERALFNLAFDKLQSVPTSLEAPLISWAMTAHPEKHNWQGRVIEYLHEGLADSLGLKTEFVILLTDPSPISKGVVDENIDRIFDLFRCRYDPKALTKLRETVRVVEDIHAGPFYVGWARLRLLQETTGDFVFFRDADTAMITGAMTRTLLVDAVKHRVGMLGIPSLRDGDYFKPRSFEPRLEHSAFPGLTLVHGVHGMATFGPANLQRSLPWNPALVGWGEHLSFSTKLARSGYISAYTQKVQIGLATSRAERDMPALTDDLPLNSAVSQHTDPVTTIAINPEKILGGQLISDFYGLFDSPTLMDRFKEWYGFSPCLANLGDDLLLSLETRRSLYNIFQAWSVDIYTFEPMASLNSGEMTQDFLDSAYERTQPLYAPIEEKLKALSLWETLGLPV